MPNRNWAIWRARRVTGATLGAIGREHGIGREPVRQMVAKRDKAVLKALTRSLDVPTPDETREGILGVEFVFTHESLAEGPGWDSLATGDRVDWDTRGLPRIPTYAHVLDEGIVYRVKKVSEGD